MVGKHDHISNILPSCNCCPLQIFGTSDLIYEVVAGIRPCIIIVSILLYVNPHTQIVAMDRIKIRSPDSTHAGICHVIALELVAHVSRQSK